MNMENYPGCGAPETVFTFGDPNILQQRMLALFCSVKCPGNAILKTYDLARALRDAGVPVISGFHTPMERECLDLLLRGTQPIVVCPARGIEGMRLPQAMKAGVDAGRVLLVSPFGPKQRRATAELADQRNRLVAALAIEVFVAYAAPGGKTEKLCREVVAKEKPLFTVACPENANLISLGAKPMAIDEIVKQWGRHDSEDG
ncbi:MAG: DNA-processing protein DprA [Acidobacteria bacterium]|nr:DNA-processing protein DprA [Acidobacteriota bacterium]